MITSRRRAFMLSFVLALGASAVRADRFTWIATASNPNAPFPAREEAIENLLDASSETAHDIIVHALSEPGPGDWREFLMRSLESTPPRVDDYALLSALIRDDRERDGVRAIAASRITDILPRASMQRIPMSDALVTLSFWLGRDRKGSFWLRKSAARLFAGLAALPNTNPVTVLALVTPDAPPHLRDAALSALVRHVASARTAEAQTKQISDLMLAYVTAPEQAEQILRVDRFDASSDDESKALALRFSFAVPAWIERACDRGRALGERLAALAVLQRVPPQNSAQYRRLAATAEVERTDAFEIGVARALAEVKTERAAAAAQLRELLQIATSTPSAVAILESMRSLAAAAPRDIARDVALEAFGYLQANESKAACKVADNLSDFDDLDDPDDLPANNPCLWALRTLGETRELPQEVVPKLQSLVSGRPSDPLFTAAVHALGMYGAAAAPAREELLHLLNVPQNRHDAALALGNIGSEAAAALPHLVKALDEEARQPVVNGHSVYVFGEAVDQICSDIVKKADEIAKDGPKLAADRDFVESALKVLGNSTTNFIGGDQPVLPRIEQKLSGAQTALRNAYAAHKRYSLLDFVRGSVIAQVVLGVVAWLLVCLLLLRFRPLTLLSMHAWLQRVLTVKIPTLDVFIPIGHLFLVSLFAFHRRVLDAWVAKYADGADKRFRMRDTVKERLAHIQLPAELNGTKIDSGLTPGQLRQIFQDRTCLLIHGEGGAGKTSLACQIAFWGMTADPSQRICAQRVLPILIDHNLKKAEGKDGLRETIAGQLRNLIGESDSIPDELVDALMRKGRLLVIVDHFSEMLQETRDMIRPAAPDFPVRLMVVTSRLHETLDGAVAATIRPMRIRFAELSQFMQHYLDERQVLQTLTQKAFYDYCGNLAEIAGGSDVTVLFARLFADLVAGNGDASDRELPRNAPELMLSYLNQLNVNHRESDPANREVQKAARIAALECVRRKFSPQTARVDVVVQTIGGNGQVQIDYLHRLGVIRSAGPAEDSIRFALDPLAEYLAAIEQIEYAGDNEIRWQTMLKDLRALGADIDRARGYIRALIDCIEHTSVRVPDFVIAELKQELEETKAAA